MRKFFSIVAALALAMTIGAPSAHAETVIAGQIAQGDVVLAKSQSPFLVTGLIQIPAGRAFVIQPGVTVTFAPGSGVRSLGEVRIGSSGSSERVRIILDSNLHFVGNGARPTNISVVRADIYAKNSQLFQSCERLEIVESYIERVSQIIAQTGCQSVSIRDSYLSEVTNVFERYHTTAHFFELKNNVIASMSAICCRIAGYTMGAMSRQSIFSVTGNDFRNLTTINLPYSYLNYTFERNNFHGVKNVVAGLAVANSPAGHHFPESLGNNFWGGPLTEAEIRKSVNVVDGKSDIRNQVNVVFEPLARNAFAVSGFPAAKRDAINKQAADKAAADKAAADKAAADKAAADKAAADKAAADKAAADKAAADKAAADKAAADKAAADKAAADKAAADKAAADKAAADKAAANRAVAPKRYPNCSALQKVYPGGVARSAKWVNKGSRIKQKPIVNAKVYDLNKSLDRDKDGLVCER